MKDDVQAIIKLLRPGDKFRLLTIGDSVYESVPWVNAGATVDVAFRAVGGISLVQDALMFGLLHRVDPVRRHLLVGMTDRQDCGSVISSNLLLELAGRSEAVMQLVDYSGGGGDTRYRVRTCTPRARPGGVATIEEAAARTGGALQTQSRFMRASAIVRAFRSNLRGLPAELRASLFAERRRNAWLARDFGDRAEGEGRHDSSPPGLLRGRRQVIHMKNEGLEQS
jgi:hypothetical protein